MGSKIISKQEDQRKRIYEFYISNRTFGKKFTVNHFISENIPKSTIYSIIDRAENESGHERVQGSGRVAKIMKPSDIGKLIQYFDHQDGISQRQAARKFKCSQSYVNKTLRTKTLVKCNKKKRIPDRSDDQKASAQIKCDRLYRKLANLSVVMDDESYFTLGHSTINGNNFFYSSNKKQTLPSVKYATKSKFEKKLLVWIAISEKGITTPYFVPSGLAVNQKIYLEHCIQKRLIPFIKKHHSDGNYMFWPDLASSHYAKSVIQFFDENKIKYVKRFDNPANLPEVRPIENFWSILKGLVYKNYWKAENLEKLEARIKYCLSKVEPDLVKSLMQNTRSLVGQIRTNGVIEKN